jgi:glycosyltransferase involved in cell wall biosynthesis
VRIAIVHDWLVSYAGSERALEQIIALYPEADLFSLVDFLPPGQRSFLLEKKVTTSFIQSLPFARRKYRSYLPLMPFAIEQFDLSAYDLIISSSHAVAKGVLTNAGQPHVCYCYTPMRYAWDLHHQYLKESGLNKGFKGQIARMVLHYLRLWDRTTSDRADHYIAISQYIAQRIKKAYAREAAVIYPPVDIDSFVPGPSRGEFYLTASRMVPYKKMDLIVEAFSAMPERKLVVIGDGPDFKKIRSKAGRNVELLGFQPAAVMRSYLQQARAFVFAAEEDFGIVTVEAQACGTPVIAFGRGGSRETIIDGVTGIFFHEQSTAEIRSAIQKFERIRDSFDPKVIRNNAERFSTGRFKKEFKDFVDTILAQ